RLGEPFPVAAQVDDRLAERHPGGGAPAGQVERHLRQPDQPHAVVDAPRPEPSLRDLRGTPRARDDVRDRQPHALQAHLPVAPGPELHVETRSRTPYRTTSPCPRGSSGTPCAGSMRSTVTPGASIGTRTME